MLLLKGDHRDVGCVAFVSSPRMKSDLVQLHAQLAATSGNAGRIMQTNFTTAQLRDPQIQAAHRAVVKILLRDGTDKGQVFAARRPSPRNGSDLNRIMRALRRLKKYRAPRKGVVELCGGTDLYSQQDRLRRLHCIARPDWLVGAAGFERSHLE